VSDNEAGSSNPNRPVIYGSVCSGIEAASAAWHPLGWKPAWFSEIEPFPCSVLKHHYPDVPNLGDMTKWEDWPSEAIDVLVGGTPCQSFSVAGKRAGMDDPRGQLALAFSAIARRYKPRWIVWENVPGVLSSGGGRDFGSFIGSLVELGYGCAYRVLDAQWFGVAQRRRRVFVVGHLGDWRRAAAVLLERESLRRDTPPSREAREEVAANAGDGTATSDRWPAKTACTLYASFGSKLGLEDQHINEGASLFVLSSGQAGSEISCDSSPTLTCLHEAPIVTLRREMHGHDVHAVMQAMQVRRLTPIECERLQGFPDNYTNVPHRGKPAPDGPRYKALGNSMAVPCMAWIGRRIQMVEAIKES
jgi:DNA (cytosine-5)-methyltransferase 1